MRLIGWLTLAVAAWGASAAAQATPVPVPAVFDRLEGAWDGEGTLLGRTGRFTMRWERHAGFAVLTFRNAFVDSTGRVTPVLSAVATYRTSAQQPEAVWLDSRGIRIEIAWEASDSTLLSHWTAPNETGRTTYRVLATGEIEVRDEVASGETWRTFAAARYLRAPF